MVDPVHPTDTSASAGTALLGIGQVRHQRLRPLTHAFAYPTRFLMLPMRRLREAPEPALARNRRAALSFFDCDHGLGGPDALSWMEALLQAHGIHDADGEIWLQTYPRLFGHAFKPVSFWLCERRDGGLAAVVAEVNNTFGERHCYLLRGPGLSWGRTQTADKVFHVSPFCKVAGDYRFRFMRTPARAGQPARFVARVEHHDSDGPLLLTSLSGHLEPLTTTGVRRAVLHMPLLGVGVLARIHLQALRLWWRRLPFFSKPAAPSAFVTR